MKQYIDYNDIKNRSLDRLNEIQNTFLGYNKIIAITRGGLSVAGILGQLLNIKDYDIVSISSYKGVEEQGEIDIRKIQRSTEKVIICDDVIDSGKTMDLVKRYYPKGKIFVLNSKKNYKVDFCLYPITDKWLVYPWELDE